MQTTKFVPLLCALLLQFVGTSGSHFRGAIITWKPGATEDQIIIEYRISWRRSYDSNLFCDDKTIQSAAQINGEGSMECFDGCFGNIGALSFQCTDYSEDEDWTSGKGRITYQLPSSKPQTIAFGFSGTAWINLNNGGNSWRLRVTADLRVRNDTGRINTSPTAEVNPIVRLQRGCNHTISIPVSDYDNDIVRCRQATRYPVSECGGVCAGLPNSVLDEGACKISYSAVDDTGWYAVALQVEDFIAADPLTPLSSIPVQFLVQVFEGGDSCVKSVEFILPTPPDNACIGVPTNESYESSIVARVAQPNIRLSEIKTISPLGMTKGELRNISDVDWRMNISWTSADSTVRNVFCFSAVETSGRESEKRCITLLAGVTAPAFETSSISPSGEVDPSNRQWSISVNTPSFIQTSRETYIRLFNEDDVLEETMDASVRSYVNVDPNNRKLTFFTSTQLVEKQHYYFVFDFGVIRGTSHCGAESVAITDPSFWRFRVRDVTPPKITFTTSPTTTNSTADFEWTVNEPTANVTCTFTKPGLQAETINCNGQWSETDLPEGLYTLTITAIDLEQNIARVTHVWTVDTTPPVAWFTQQPNAVSNDNPVNISWTCLGGCIPTCSLQGLAVSQKIPCSGEIARFTLPNTNSDQTYIFQLDVRDKVWNVASFNYSWKTDFIPPEITPCDSGQKLTVDCEKNFLPHTVCNVSVSDNMDSSPSLTYEDTNTGTCGFTRTWTAHDTAGNIATKVQNFDIVSNKSMTILRSPAPMSIACGSLANMTDIFISMFEVEHPCNLDVEFNHEDNVDESCDVLIERTWTITDDCNRMVNAIQFIRVRQAQVPIFPENGQTGIDLNLELRWVGPTSDIQYDVYLWLYSTDRPSAAYAEASQPVLYIENLHPGIKYSWQVVFHFTKDNETYLSPVWAFETRRFADLVVSNIEFPSMGFTGQSYEIRWTVVNNGIATQFSYWTDAVYMSWDDSFQSASLIARVSQRRIVLSNDGYSSSARFTLGNSKVGQVRFFVMADYRGYLEEYNTSNNLLQSSSTMEVALTPPPDLQVASIRLPGTTFYSGNSVSLTWIVSNLGQGPTQEGYWTDRIWLSPNDSITRESEVLTLYRHQENILQGASVSTTVKITLPEFKSGYFFVLVEVDVYNNVFEHTGESNNFMSLEDPIRVILTPPPDLVVKSIDTPLNWTTGDTVEVKWTVENEGDDSPQSQTFWRDYVYLTSGGRWWMDIGTQYHIGLLQSYETYTLSLSFYVTPSLPSGDYNITVHCDYRNNLFEYTHDDNNQLILPVTVTKALPDLTVTNFTATVRNEPNSTRLDVFWSVENIGAGKTLSLQWSDVLYIKLMAAASYDLLEEFTVNLNIPLLQAHTYTKNATLYLPLSVFGQIALMVESGSALVESKKENNFYTIPSINVDLRAADMSVQINTKPSGSIQGGAKFEVEYTVFNLGNKKIVDANWADSVYLAENKDDKVAYKELSVVVNYNRSLNLNESYAASTILQLHDDLSGPYYLIVETDINNDIFEGGRKTNNRVAILINVEIAPAADLSVQSLSVTDNGEINGDKIFSVIWQVTNKGNSMASIKLWSDTVFATHDLKSSSSRKDLGTFAIENRLLSQSSYELERNVVLPIEITGNIFVCVQVDATSSVFEVHSLENNVRCTNAPIFIQPNQGPSLLGSVTNVSSTSEDGVIVPGSKIVIEYNILNVGDRTTPKTSWMDSVYVADVQISTVSQLRQKGIRVKEIVHIGSLHPSEDYRVVTTVTVPLGFSGSPMFYIIPDDISSDKSQTSEVDNSSSAVETVTSYLPKEQITFLLPNLFANSSEKLTKLDGGQPVTVHYNVTNDGNITTYQAWYDSVFLSEDYTIDVFDTKLKSNLRAVKLDAGETISLNISFFLPMDLATKSYFLAIVCDSRNDVFEDNEDDNVLRFTFDMQARASTDLFVTKVVSPMSAEYGTSMSVSWEVSNNGTKSASGYKCDSVYLSDDKKWDINDHQLGKPYCSHFHLDANATEVIPGSVQHTVPHVAAQNYSTLVKTRSNIIDVFPDNDVGIAEQKTEISYRLLEIDQQKTIQLSPYMSVAFRIPNVIEDKTIVLNVTSDYYESFNSVFIKAGRPATLYDFDQTSDNPSSPDHILTVPDTLNDDYYVLIENAGFVRNSKVQSLDISVKYAKFEVMTISPDMLLIGSQTTIRITGTLFPYDMQAILHFNDTASSSIMAKSTRVFSTTEAYATFVVPSDLPRSSGVLGLRYNKGHDDKFTDFRLRSGTGQEGYISTFVENLERFRAGETADITVSLTNKGSSDVLAPFVIVKVIGDGAIQLRDSGREEMYKQQHRLIGNPSEGPSGIFPPQSQGTFRFKAQQFDSTVSTSLQFEVSALKVSQEIRNPYLDLKEILRPSHYDSADWEQVWENFVKMVGNSTLTLSKRVSEILSDMSLAGTRIQNMDDITDFLLEYADAPYGDRVLLRESLFNKETEAEIGLSLEYTMPARIGSRKQKGYFGNGWILPLWDTKIKSLDESTLKLTLEREDYDFIKVDDNVYLHSKLGTITKVDSDFILRRVQNDKEFHFDVTTLRLKSVLSLIDNSGLKLSYDGNRLTRVQHSNGPYVEIKYSDRGLISSMELINSTTNGVTELTFLYDFESGLLQGIRSSTGTIRFRYNYRDSSLRYVSFEDGLTIVYEYNSFGHLAARRFVIAGNQVKGLEYSYGDGGTVSVHEIPENTVTTYTFGTKGELIRSHTNDSVPQKTVVSSGSETMYIGDVLLLRRRFDSKANQVVIEDGNGDTIRTRFNDKGQLSEFVDGRGNKYTVDINVNGTLKTVHYPDGTNRSYSYFDNGHVTTLQSGDKKSYEFNARRQILKKTGTHGATWFEYDNEGKLTTAANEMDEVKLEYFNDLPAKMIYPTHTVDYTFNDNKQKSGITTSNGYKVSYSYDQLGHMTQVTDENENVLVDAEYDEAGRIIKKTFGNKAVTAYKYDMSTGLLTNLLNYFPNGTLASFFNYTYSARNRRISVATSEGLWKFRYDRTGQVMSMTNPYGKTTEYAYDETKNRKTVSVNGIQAVNTVNDMNQYVEYGNMKYKHDKNGNLIERQSETGHIEILLYDDENKLIGYESSLNNCTYNYSAIGHFNSKSCGDVTTQYVVNMDGNYGADILEQIVTTNGQVKKTTYYHGDDVIGLISARHDDGKMNYFMFDPLGSVVNILDENGDLLSKFERNPFGELISVKGGSRSSLFGFIGQWGVLDMAEIPGTYLMHDRLYDSYTGRFMSLDPVGIKAHSKNFYAYCFNDPVHFNDPKGDCPVCIWALKKAGKAAIKGAFTGVYDYLKNTPRSEWTWGGAAGSAVTGGLKGAINPFRKFLPKPLEIAYDSAVTVAGNWVQHKIDKEPYSFDDARKDFISSVVDDTIGHFKDKYKPFKDAVEGLEKECAKIEKYFGTRPELCDWPEKIKDTLNNWAEKIMNWIRSRDPNDMLGPAGYGPAQFIPKDLVMKYKIRFENYENATAPAQRVYVEHSYSEHLDPRTFQMGDFGFGNFTQVVQERQKSFQGTIDLKEEMGFVVRVFAGLDIVNKILTWEFQTIDHNTGEAPVDPGIGFLPPNNGTSGQGYVTFSIKLRRDVTHLATVNANASIFFDENEPIDTPNIFHTIDDESPVVNASVISETLSVDSVAISLRSADSGSGPAFVDVFQKQENSLVLFKEGVAENILVLQLAPGISYDLLPIPVDNVGNRQSITEIDAIEFISIVSNTEPGNCSCSGNGNCTWTNVCVCNDGFYGTTCSSTTKPLEPPVLDVKAQSGFSNEGVDLKLSARNISGALEDIQIFVTGFPDGSSFSKGTITSEGSLVLSNSEFGTVTMTTSYEGQVQLVVTALQKTSGSNVTRTVDLMFAIYQKPNVDVLAYGCFFNNSDGVIQAKLNSSVEVQATTMDSQSNQSFVHSVELHLPPDVHPVGRLDDKHKYDIDDAIVNFILDLNAPEESFNVTIVVKVQYPDLPAFESMQTVDISMFCNAAPNCECVEENTKTCMPSVQTCVCKNGWSGNHCENDVNECTNVDICKSQANTACQNKEGGYDCLCRVGYQYVNNGCVALEVDRNDTVSPADKKFDVTIRVNVDVPDNANLEVASTYEVYFQRAFNMLEQFYKHTLGNEFMRLIINGIRRGSLIINHTVVTTNTSSAAQTMASALTQLSDPSQTPLEFDGKATSVIQVTVDNSQVTGKDVCDVYTSIDSCDDNVCVIEQNRPVCRPAPPTESDKSKTILIVALAVGIPVCLLISCMIIGACCRRARQNKKKELFTARYQHRLSSEAADPKPSQSVEFSNLMYST